MKTSLLILLLACSGVWAQTSTDINGLDDAARDAALRRAVRAAQAGDTNAAMMLASDARPMQLAQAGGSASNYFAVPALPTNRPSRPPGINPAAFGTNNSGGGVRTTGNAPATTPQIPTLPQPPALNSGAAVPANPANPAGQAVPAGLQFPTPAATPAVTAPEQKLPAGIIDLKDASLDAALGLYAELVGRTLLHAQLPQLTVSLKTQTELTKSEAIEALQSVFAMNNITLVPVGDKFIKVETQPQGAFGAAMPFNTRDVKELPEADQFVSDIVQLKYTKPSELVQVLQPFAQLQGGILPIDGSGMLVLRDYSGNVKRMLELIRQVDTNAPLDYEEQVIPIKYAKASDIASALSSLGGGTGTSIGHSATTGSGSHMGGTLGGMGTGTFGGAMGNTGYNPANPGGINQPNTMGNQRTSSFTDRLNSIVKRAAAQGEFQVLGQTKIIADERTNSLLVFAGRQDMEMITNIIAKLDTVLAQVLIESIIMEVSLDNSHALGFSYVQNQPTSAGHGYFSGLGGLNNGTFLNPGSFASAGTNLAGSLPSGFSYWANFGNDFQATMTAIAADSRINVLSRPRIQTSHGVTATIQVGQQVPMITGTYFGGLSGVGSSSQYQQQFVGIQLQVTPLINPDGLVVMDIQQQVQQLGNNYTIDGNQVPSTTQRSAQATVSVKDRDTIILGGMISSSKNTSHSGVPILKDIPGLGALFRSSSVDNQRVELIVLIRPTVLPTPEAAALVATHERNRLPGVKAAEAEERRDEIQRLKEADKIKVPDEKY